MKSGREVLEEKRIQELLGEAGKLGEGSPQGAARRAGLGSSPGPRRLRAELGCRRDVGVGVGGGGGAPGGGRGPDL